MKYYFKAFKNYAKCKGRAMRKELWMFVLFHYIVTFALAFLDGVLFGNVSYMTIIYYLAAICPIMCLEVRRLHDVGKSGFWLWAAIVPILNWYLAYLIFFKASVYTIEANAYEESGDCPKHH